MMIQTKCWFLVLMVFTLSCNFKSENTKPPTFYNTISDWDIAYIPIMEPFRASSIDNGTTWSLNKEELNSIPISEFGVSENFIFGKSGMRWFLFNTKSKLYAEYNSEKELNNCLQRFKVTITPTAHCNSYFDSLAKGKKCYWFPNEGQKYPEFPDIIPVEINQITITESENNPPDFVFNHHLKLNDINIYYFRVKYKRKDNDIYYISLDNSRPILIKDSLVIPFFTAKQEFDVSVYTPYTVAQDKGIPEDKRFVKTKLAYIR